MSDGRGDGRPAEIDPVAMARRDLKKALPRRFYAAATVGPAEGGGFAVLLDGRPVRTPAKLALAVPNETLAEALAAEWRAQGEIIEPDTMPLTRLVNSALDGVAKAREATLAEVAKFAETDLVCYRAGAPAALVAAQAAAWDPVLAFARDALGARFILAEGVMYVAQPEPALAAVRHALEAEAASPSGALRLAALSVMTSLTGSVLLALAVTRGAMAPADAWRAAHVDEDHQIAIWGHDAEAAARRGQRWRDMEAAASLAALTAG